MNLDNQRGSIFIQALISIAIFSLITAVVVRLLQMQNNLSSKTTEQFEMVYFVDEVRNILSSSMACKENFLNKNARRDKSTTEIIQVMNDEHGDIYSFVIYEKGSVIKETKDWTLTLSDIYLQSDSEQTSIEAGTTNLFLEASFKNNLNGRVHKLNRKVKLFVSINNSEEIQNCYTVRGLGLGKGLNTEESSWIRTSDTKGHYLKDKNLFIKTTKGSSPLNLIGPLQISSSDISCLKEVTGLIRYNSKTEAFEVCSPSTLTWRDLNTPVPLRDRIYALRASLPIIKATTPRPFKYCSITYKNYEEGKCLVRRLEDGRWELNHQSSKSNFGTCEASCYY